MRNGSANNARTLKRGLSEPVGSWNIIAMRRRIGFQAGSVRPVTSRGRVGQHKHSAATPASSGMTALSGLIFSLSPQMQTSSRCPPSLAFTSAKRRSSKTRRSDK